MTHQVFRAKLLPVGRSHQRWTWDLSWRWHHREKEKNGAHVRDELGYVGDGNHCIQNCLGYLARRQTHVAECRSRHGKKLEMPHFIQTAYEREQYHMRHERDGVCMLPMSHWSQHAFKEFVFVIFYWCFFENYFPVWLTNAFYFPALTSKPSFNEDTIFTIHVTCHITEVKFTLTWNISVC